MTDEQAAIEVMLAAALDGRVKLCECGCGKPAPIAKKSNPEYGWVKGKAKKFIDGHQNAKAAAARRIPFGKSTTPEYKAFIGARDRCTNPENPSWAYYGGRGIRFEFESFLQFSLELGPRPTPEHSLDRRDNDGPYAPWNCRWTTIEVQNANRRPPCRDRTEESEEPEFCY
ncbi:MAG: hypothetical protein ACRD20_19510 [Terriglobales bacterium]